MNSIKKEVLWSANFIKLALANLFMATAFYFLIPSLPIYFKDVLLLDGISIGVLLSAYTFSAVLIRPIVGFSLDTFGRKWLFLIAFLLFSLMFNFYHFASTFMLMLLVRILHGFIWGGITVSNSTIVVDVIPAKRRGEGIGVFGLSMTIAMAIGPMIGIVLYNTYNYSTMFLIASVLSFTGLAIALTVKYPKFVRHAENKRFNLKLLYEKSTLPISVGLMILLIPYGGLMSLIAIYSKEIDSTQTGLFFLILAIGIFIARMLTGKIFDKQGPDKLISYSTILFAFGFLTLANIKTPIGFYSAAFLLGLGNGIIFPSFQAMVNNIIPVFRRGAANSTLLTFLDFGIGGGMLIMPWVSKHFNLSFVYNLSAFICVIGWFFYVLVIKNYYKNKKIEFDMV